MAYSCPPEDDIGIPACYKNIPLEALRVSARKRLSLYLNLERLPNERGIVPDFNGLAEEIGFSYLEQQNFARLRDPTLETLSEWTRRPDLDPTVGNLFKYLTNMERYDVLTDCRQIILTDIQHYVSQQERRQNSIVPLQDDTISQSSTVDDTDHNVDEYRYMTVQDVENDCPTFYDAFVCYDPDGYDLQFVKKMISELESPVFGLKLFVPFRDDLPGSATYTITAKLIQARCRRMVIILSPRFLTSPACDFQTKFAHCLSPGSRSKKLVPVLITDCVVPQILKPVTLCDFTKRDLKEWVWVRLARAIKAPISFKELQISTKADMDAIKISRDEYHRSSSSNSSSQPLPIIIPANPNQIQSVNSPANSPMEVSVSPKYSHNLSGCRSMPVISGNSSQIAHSPGNCPVDASGSPRSSLPVSSPSSLNTVPNPAPIKRRQKSIPQLFPSSQR